MTDPGAPPLARLAGQVVRFAAPLLRIRYPEGVYVNLRGFPEWAPYARALVELGAPPSDASADVVRVADVLAANQVMGASGDPLWHGADASGEGRATGPVMATPDGWVWAHCGGSRRLALVPVEAHSAFRHVGGMATLRVDRRASGLPMEACGKGAVMAGAGEAAEPDIATLEGKLGARLPASYREFLAAANGVRPATPLAHPGFGFVADQSFFGFGRREWHSNLSYGRQWFRDRFTDDFLPIGHVQGGVLVVRLAGSAAGSVWYYDDDDHRENESYDAAAVCEQLLHRCADDFATFLSALAPVPESVCQQAQAMLDEGLVRQITDRRHAGALPSDRRPPQFAG